MKYVRALDYELNGTPVHVTDAVDTSLVTSRTRSYEQAGAASAAAVGKLENKQQQPEKSA